MNYEKKYKEALEKAIKLSKELTVDDIFEQIFPELKESEDEKMKKIISDILIVDNDEIREILDSNDVLIQDVWAWLEKQGDKDKLIQELGKYKVKYAQEVLEKHINSMSNKDDERLRKTTIAFLKDFADKGYENAVECIDWLEKQGAKVSAIEGFETEFERQVSSLIASAINKEHEYNQGYVKWTANALLNYAKHELEKQGKQNPYSGISFNYNGHTWGMCARDNGVDILLDKQLLKHLEEQGEKKSIDDLTPQEAMDIAVAKCFEQGEQNPANGVEPKFNFKVGQYIVATGKRVYLIAKIDGFNVTLIDTNGNEYVFDTSSLDDAYQWTIQDAKDGDVIFYDDGWTCIFKNIHGIWYSSYCFITADGEFHTSYERHAVDAKLNGNAKPATKEQRERLEKAMTDAGYTFDFDKKELKRIEDKPL